MAPKVEKEVRESCLLCVAKHIGQARALSLEMSKGYPHHYFFALGHLAEAEDECIKDFPNYAAFIRDQRLQWQEDACRVPSWTAMIGLIVFRFIGKNDPAHFTRKVFGFCNGTCKDCPAQKRGKNHDKRQVQGRKVAPHR